MIKQVILPLLMTLCTVAVGQHKVSLNILDEHQHPIEGAHIRINHDQAVGVSDSEGRALFELATGPLQIEVSYLGLRTYRDTLQLSGPLDLAIVLESESQVFCSVIIEAHDQKIPGSSRRAEHLSMQRKLATGISGTNAALGQLAGVSLESTGPTAGRPLIRGLGGPRIRLNVNGATLASQSWSSDHAVELSTFSTDEIELVRGSHALWFGGDAAGGVIEYIGYTPKRNEGWFGRVQATGTTGMIGGEGALRVGKSGADRYAYVEAEYGYNGAFVVPIDSFEFEGSVEPIEDQRIQNSAVKTTYVKGVVGQRKGGDKRFVVDYLERTSGFFPPLYEGDVVPGRGVMELNDPYQKNRHFTLGMPLEWDLEKSSFELILNYQFDDREEWAVHHGEEELEQMLDLELNQYSVLARRTKEYGWSYGGNYIFQNSVAGGEEYLIPGYRQTEGGFFATYSNKIKAHDFGVGMRLDGRNVRLNDTLDSYSNYGGWSATLSDEIKLEKGLLLVQVSRVFRAPSIHELSADGVHHGAFRHERGSLDLSPEMGMQYSLGYQLYSGRVNVRSSIYYYDYSNFIRLAPTGMESPLEPEFELFTYGEGEADLYGAELDVRYFANKWQMRAMGSFVQGETGSVALARMPQNRAELMVQREVGDHWIVDAAWEHYFDQNRVADYEMKTPGGGVLNLNASYYLESFRLSAGVYNLLNNSVLSHLDVYRQFGIPRMGRSLSLTITKNF